MSSHTIPPDKLTTKNTDNTASTPTITLDVEQPTSPSNRLEYSDTTPAQLTLTLTNESTEHIATGKFYIEALPTAHVEPDIESPDFMPLPEPNTWELLTTLEPGDSLTLTLTITTDGLPRDTWDGQLDIVSNYGMEIIDKKTVFIKG